MGLIAPRDAAEGRYFLLITYMNKSRVALGGGVRQQEKADAQMHGFREGVAAALAVELSVAKSQLYSDVRWVDAINDWEVFRVLEDARKNGLDPEHGEEENWTDVVHDKDSKTRFILKLSEKLDNMIEDEHLTEEARIKRHSKILAGEIKAADFTDEDREWLTAEAERQKKLTDEMVAILMGTQEQSGDDK